MSRVRDLPNPGNVSSLELSIVRESNSSLKLGLLKQVQDPFISIFTTFVQPWVRFSKAVFLVRALIYLALGLDAASVVARVDTLEVVTGAVGSAVAVVSALAWNSVAIDKFLDKNVKNVNSSLIISPLVHLLSGFPLVPVGQRHTGRSDPDLSLPGVHSAPSPQGLGCKCFGFDIQIQN